MLPRLTFWLPLLVFLLAGPVHAVAGDSQSTESGPLTGVPLSFTCEAEVDPYHPLVRDHRGRDLFDFIPNPSANPVTALSGLLCDQLWKKLADAGAHRSPSGVSLPAMAKLHARLVAARLSSERISQEFYGSNLSFLPVPHWAVELSWVVDFALTDSSGHTSHNLNWKLFGSATHGDYAPLELESLLTRAMRRAFAALPERLGEEGGLGNLFFARVERPDTTPGALNAPNELASSFGLLLNSDLEVRHATMAIMLSSERLNMSARRELAAWFMLNDPDVPLRQDAMTWLLSPVFAGSRGLEEAELKLLRWIVEKDRSWRVRSKVVEIASKIDDETVRPLLLFASLERDPRVSDRAHRILRDLAPATQAEMDEALKPVTRPNLATWTVALDGRVGIRPGADTAQLVTLAELSESPLGLRWLDEWITRHPSPGPAESWVWDAWTRLAAHPNADLRASCLARFAREMTQVRTGNIVVERVYNEPLPSLRASAIALLDHAAIPGILGALLEASRSTSAEVRRASATALAMMSDHESGARLTTLTEDPDRKVKRAAKKSLRLRARAARRAR